MLTGFKTIIWSAIMAGFPTISAWLLNIDWVHVIQGWGVPQVWVVPLAGLVGGIITAILRFFTSSPIFQK